MSKRHLLGTITLICILSIFFTVSVQAGGLGTYNFATPDVGLAAAGSAARAQDAGTIATNPAGMMLLGNREMLYGGQMIYGNVGFTPGSGSTAGGNDGGQPIGWVPGGSFFYVETASPKVKYGIGMYSNFGSMLDYDNNWVGRYYIQEGALLGMSLTPAVAYRANEHFSVGVAANVMYGMLKSQVAVNNVLDGLGDGQLKIKDSAWGVGGNIGLMYEFNPKTRMGLTYNSQVKLNFADTNEWSNLGPGLQTILANRGLLNSQTHIDLTVPQQVMLSYYHEINPKWSIMGNVGWQNWSKFGYAGISVDSNNPTSLVKNMNYNDTWHGAIGVQYRLDPKWILSCGISYDTSAVDDVNRTVTVPMGEVWQLGLGATHILNPSTSVNFAYSFGWMGDMPVNQYRGPLAGTVQGSYKNANCSVFSVSMSKRL